MKALFNVPTTSYHYTASDTLMYSSSKAKSSTGTMEKVVTGIITWKENQQVMMLIIGTFFSRYTYYLIDYLMSMDSLYFKI